MAKIRDDLLVGFLSRFAFRELSTQSSVEDSLSGIAVGRSAKRGICGGRESEAPSRGALTFLRLRTR